MDATKLAAIVGLLVALSAASERLVEIVKGLCPWLDKKNSDPKIESRRTAALQGLAVVAGIGTTIMARPAIPETMLPESSGVWPLIALGFLASGGSGLWNAVLTYVLKLKDIKEELAKIAADKAKVSDALLKSPEVADAATADAFGRNVARAEAMGKLDSVVVGLVVR